MLKSCILPPPKLIWLRREVTPLPRRQMDSRDALHHHAQAMGNAIT